MSIRALMLAIMIAVAAPVGAAQALMLDTWNVDELQASDDYVDLQFGIFNGKTTLTLQWLAGVDDTPGALGIDKFFINNTDSTLEVVGVFMNSVLPASDVTSSWLPTNGGTNAGGGFGRFVEKVAEPAGVGGQAPDSLIFVLDGLYNAASFVPNSDGATFAAHLRYDNGCSGWVADGGTPGDGGSKANCGGVSPVPEPSAALVFAAGAIVVGGALRRRR